MRNILVVEDERDINLLLTAILRSSGYHVSSALTVESAMEHLNRFQFHTIFLDVNLGLSDGLSLIPLIRQMQHDAEIVVMTAQSNLAVHDAVSPAEVYKFVSKPFSKDEVLKMV